MSNNCPYNTGAHPCELEIEYAINQAALQEAEECFGQIRKDYQLLREYTDKLEALLREHGIDYPVFYGW